MYNFTKLLEICIAIPSGNLPVPMAEGSIRNYEHTHINTYVYIYLYGCMYIYIYICIHITMIMHLLLI